MSLPSSSPFWVNHSKSHHPTSHAGRFLLWIIIFMGALEEKIKKCVRFWVAVIKRVHPQASLGAPQTCLLRHWQEPQVCFFHECIIILNIYHWPSAKSRGTPFGVDFGSGKPESSVMIHDVKECVRARELRGSGDASLHYQLQYRPCDPSLVTSITSVYSFLTIAVSFHLYF